MIGRIRSWAVLPLVAALVALSAFPLAAQQWAQRSKIFATWSASPSWGAPQQGAGFSNETIRTIFFSSVAGGRAQIRISNLYGSEPITVAHAALAVATSGASIAAGTSHDATFNGQAAVVIQPGGTAICDPITMAIPSQTNLAVSLFFSDAQGTATNHANGHQTSYIVANDNTTAASLSGATTTLSRYFVSEVDVRSPTAMGTVVTFGDSITDGVGSTTDANHRWPDFLSARLEAAGLPYGIANAGIGGNGYVVQVSASYGQNASARFDRDVLSLPNVTHLIILLGINDIGLPGTQKKSPTPAARIIEGLSQLTARARERGIKVYAGTLLPFAGTVISNFYNADAEAVRQQVNAYIRGATIFDGIIDFDQVMRDPSNPTYMRADYASYDHLHPNDTGYQAMANAIPLRFFR